MRTGSYTVSITPGNEVEGGYVRMTHDTPYTIALVNHGDEQCDAELKVDGKFIGTFRLPQGGRQVLERPPYDSGRFTFYRSGTTQAAASGVDEVSADKQGVITVTFTPERARPKSILRSAPQPDVADDPDDRRRRFGLLAAGGTGLSGHSDQQFVDVESIDRDENRRVVINLRLVEYVAAARPRELQPAPAPLSNPVPPPVRQQ